jgi:hypothetical protein
MIFKIYHPKNHLAGLVGSQTRNAWKVTRSPDSPTKKKGGNPEAMGSSLARDEEKKKGLTSTGTEKIPP